MSFNSKEILEEESTGSSLTDKDYKEFLLFLYFGKNKEYMDNCLNRAYRDFNRTLHGFAKLKDKVTCYEEAKEYLKERILGLRKYRPNCQNLFDVWHESTCKGLSESFEKHGYNEFYIGQAQKWINMTLKYIFIHGEERISGLNHIYKYCHIPIDNIILEKLKIEFDVSWSRINDYETYLDFQKKFRLCSTTPLDFEFKAFME